MIMKRILTVAAFFISHLSLSLAQTAISDYQPGVTPEGAVYFLPKTAIKPIKTENKKYEEEQSFSRAALLHIPVSLC